MISFQYVSFRESLIYVGGINLEGNRYCSALDKEISEGQCWEYCFAGRGGPKDTAEELNQWIARTKRYSSIEDFHRTCDSCKYS